MLLGVNVAVDQARCLPNRKGCRCAEIVRRVLSFDRHCLADPRDQCQFRDSVQLSNAKRLSVLVLEIKT